MMINCSTRLMMQWNNRHAVALGSTEADSTRAMVGIGLQLGPRWRFERGSVVAQVSASLQSVLKVKCLCSTAQFRFGLVVSDVCVCV